jgi:hypothetical protein
MKKYIFVIAAFLLMSLQLMAQNTYLVNKCKIVKSEKCTIYKYNGNSSAKIKMAGDEYGYVTFAMGHDDKCTERVGVVTAHGDGNKILDEKVFWRWALMR